MRKNSSPSPIRIDDQSAEAGFALPEKWMVIRNPLVPSYENLWPSPSKASCLLFHMRKPSLDCAPQYFKLRMTTSWPGSPPATFSRMTSPLPSLILAWATPVLVFTLHENAAVPAAFFCQGIG